MKVCRNPSCQEEFPVFYKNRRLCKACYLDQVKTYQRGEGKQKHVEANRRYRAAGKDKKDKNKWLKFNVVNRDTLREQYFPECDKCNENLDGQGSYACSVAHGEESMKLCLVFQEWKRSGDHPLASTDEYQSWFFSDEY